MTPICVVPAMLSYQWRGTWVTNQVQVIGIDEKSQSRVSDFAKYLQHPANRQEMSFDLHESGYDTRDHLAEGPTREREDMRRAGWENRRRMARELEEQERMLKVAAPPLWPSGSTVPPPDPFAERQSPADPFGVNRCRSRSRQFDPSKEQNPGVVLGIAMSNYRKADGEEHFRVLPGEDVQLTFPTAGTPPKAVSDKFTIVDFYESKMLEYDSMFVFMPIQELQRLRGMIDPSTGSAT